MISISTKNIGNAWITACNAVMTKGSDMTDGVENITKIKEICDFYIQIQSPLTQDVILEQDGDKEMISWMRSNFLGLDPVPNWGYSYGQRIYSKGNSHLNQLEQVIQKLKKNPSSKSATVSLLDPENDSNHVPCVCVLDFKIRNGYLNLTVFLRSQEIAHKMHADAAALSEILKTVSDNVGIEPGMLNLFIASAHIYERDYEYSKRIILKYQDISQLI